MWCLRSTSPALRTRSLVAIVLGFVLALLGAAAPGEARADGDASRASRPVAVVIPIEGTIDLATVPLVSRALDDAERDGADAVVLKIDTFGGRVDAAVPIRDRILASRVRTVAFVAPRAISAGALIALACETIVMQEGGTIGAATPVLLNPSGASTAVDEKTTSYVRKEFRATAERRGRPPLLAEAMVDASIDVPLAPAGKLLTLTTDEAVGAGVADARGHGVEDVLAFLGIAGADRIEARHTWAEQVVRIVTNPVVASLLLSLGMLGLFVEIRTPGFGVPGLVGIACFALFFFGHTIASLAGYEEMLLAALGIILLAIEIFVVPGFGVVGVAGIVALALAFGMSLVGAGATPTAILATTARVVVSFLLAGAAFVATLSILPRTRLARGLVLGRSLDRARDGGANGLASEPATPRVGSVGTTLTPLRPAGTAAFGGARVDVVSEGQFLAAGKDVELVRREGHRLVVRPRPVEESIVGESRSSAP